MQMCACGIALVFQETRNCLALLVANTKPQPSQALTTTLHGDSHCTGKVRQVVRSESHLPDLEEPHFIRAQARRRADLDQILS
jgi:hypothetical protein